MEQIVGIGGSIKKKIHIVKYLTSVFSTLNDSSNKTLDAIKP